VNEFVGIFFACFEELFFFFFFSFFVFCVEFRVSNPTRERKHTGDGSAERRARESVRDERESIGSHANARREF